MAANAADRPDSTRNPDGNATDAAQPIDVARTTAMFTGVLQLLRQLAARAFDEGK